MSLTHTLKVSKIEGRNGWAGMGECVDITAEDGSGEVKLEFPGKFDQWKVTDELTITIEKKEAA